MKNNELNEWLKQIDIILESNFIKNNIELQKIFVTAKKALKNNENDALARLSNNISWYLITHKYQAPKAVISFAQEISKEPHNTRGKIAFLQMLALSLAQM